VDALGDAVRSDPVSCENYRYDWSRDATAGVPVAVVRPANTAEVQTAMRWAAEHRVPVVPRGAGSGLSGGSSAVTGGIVVSLERMRSIEIDVAARVAVVEAGAFNADVKAAAAHHSLWYPPDPSSYEICSIGGNIATNAGGLCCVKYGVTTDYVLGLDVVLADGTLITLGGKRIKDVAGLSLLKLFVGSGGTLGIITRAVLRLIPAQGPRSTLVAYFPTVQAAADTVVTIGSTLRASMMELMDQTSINAVEDYRSMGLDRSAGAMLVAQSDAPGAACAVEIEFMEAACHAAGAKEVFVTTDQEEGELFVAARRAAFPAIEARGSIMLEDVGAPVPQLPELLAGIAAVAERTRSKFPWSRTREMETLIRSSSSSAATRWHGTVPISLSTRSCTWRSSSAAPSLASTVLGERRRPPSPTSSALTSWRSHTRSRTPSTRSASSTPEPSSSRPQGAQNCGPVATFERRNLPLPALSTAADRDNQRRLITTVPAARSCRPRRSVEMISAGSARETRSARNSARGSPSGCASSRTTAMRLSSWPKLPPASQDSTVDSMKKTVKIIHARQPPPVSTAEPKKPTATAMHAAQSMINAPIRARQLASDPRPSWGRPRRWPG